MRRIINISASIFFVWLVLTAFDIPHSLLYFLLMGDLPGTDISLSPTMMLALMTLIIGIIVFELSARRVGVIRRIRHQAIAIISRREQLPRRRFNRA